MNTFRSELSTLVSTAGRRHRHPRRDDQIRRAVLRKLESDPTTALLPIDVDVMDRRVFLKGRVHDAREARLVERAAGHVRDVGEVVDVLEVERT